MDPDLYLLGISPLYIRKCSDKLDQSVIGIIVVYEVAKSVDSQMR